MCVLVGFCSCLCLAHRYLIWYTFLFIAFLPAACEALWANTQIINNVVQFTPISPGNIKNMAKNLIAWFDASPEPDHGELEILKSIIDRNPQQVR